MVGGGSTSDRGPVRAIPAAGSFSCGEWVVVPLLAVGPVEARPADAGDVVAVDAGVASLSWVDLDGEFAPYDLRADAGSLAPPSPAQCFDNC